MAYLRLISDKRCMHSPLSRHWRLKPLSRSAPHERRRGNFKLRHYPALRWHGYRSENRYTVFQCLGHTLSLPPEQWRVLDQAHRKRNLAEYEGDIDIDEALLAALIRTAHEVLRRVAALGPVLPHT